MTMEHPTGLSTAEGEARIRRAFTRSLLAIVTVAVLAAVGLWWFNRPPLEPPVHATPLQPAAVRKASEAQPPKVPFTDITQDAGIAFVHRNGAYGDKLLPETMVGGCAFLDFDDDGDPDILLVGATDWPWHADPAAPADPAPSIALYRNEGNGKFTDVTVGSGLDLRLYGMGVAVGDYDGDGRADVFISTVGRNRLFRNLGAGRFIDVTDAAGVAGADDAWSASCAFFDADGDGDLDLFVANYVTWSREIDMQQAFKLTGIGRAYGPPLSFAGSTPYLYRNNGDGTFTEISEAAGLHVKSELGQPMAKSLGVAPYDFDHDGDIDILVANDTVRNFLFRNNGDMTFSEVGRAAGIAYDPNGNARGAMGIDAARFRNDEPSVGVVVGNFANEMTALYVSAGSALKFTDDANVTGLGPPTRLALTFGVVFADLDLDARLDIVAANGHVEDEINKVQSSQHHAQPAQLFWNAGIAGNTEFIPLDESHCGGDILRPIVGRAVAYADIDADGDLDLLFTQVGGRPVLLRNDQQLGHHYLRFQLIGAGANRHAIGARIEVLLHDQVIERCVMPARGYLSHVELPVTIGLAKAASADRVTVIWPNGVKQNVIDWKLDGVTVVRQSDSGK